MSKRHLMLKDRMELERLYGIGFGAAEIATKLKVHRSTVYNELKRGDTGAVSYTHLPSKRMEPLSAPRLMK